MNILINNLKKCGTLFKFGSSTDTASEMDRLVNLDLDVDLETLIPGKETSAIYRKKEKTLSTVTTDGTVIIKNIPAKLPYKNSETGWYNLQIFPHTSTSCVEEVFKKIETSSEKENVDVVG